MVSNSRKIMYIDKSHAINPRSSCRNLAVLDSQTTRMPCGAYVDTPSRGVTLGAFICGLKFDNIKQLYIISKWTILYNSEKDGVAFG